MNKEAIEWLRAEIEGELASARGLAVYGTGQWAVAQNGDFDFTVHDHCDAAIPQQQPIADTWREDAAHWIARHDPQDVVARCEAELAIITRCEAVLAAFTSPADGLWPDVTRRERTHASATLHDIASGYRYHTGYAGHWGDE